MNRKPWEILDKSKIDIRLKEIGDEILKNHLSKDDAILIASEAIVDIVSDAITFDFLIVETREIHECLKQELQEVMMNYKRTILNNKGFTDFIEAKKTQFLESLPHSE